MANREGVRGGGGVWRLRQRLAYWLWQRRRHDRLVLERRLGFPMLVLPSVFNPTLFHTTAFVIDHLRRHPEPGRVLDVGTGSGALAVAAAAEAARVVAVDINPEAVRAARINALLNRVEDRLEVRQADVFEGVAGERFDLVLSNPPYYAGEPATELERAFYGADFAARFTGGLGDHLSETGSALVVLSTTGEEARYLEGFAAAGLACEAEARHDLPGERLTLYRVRPAQV